MPLQIAFALGTNGERPPEAAEGGGTFGRDKPLLACLQWLRERAAAEGRGPGKEGGEALGYHPGVTCDVTGQCPLIGNRYKLRNENYDLCEDEYVKLPPDEQRRYTKIAPPCFRKPRGCGPAVWHLWYRVQPADTAASRGGSPDPMLSLIHI